MQSKDGAKICMFKYCRDFYVQQESSSYITETLKSLHRWILPFTLMWLAIWQDVLCDNRQVFSSLGGFHLGSARSFAVFAPSVQGLILL